MTSNKSRDAAKRRKKLSNLSLLFFAFGILLALQMVTTAQKKPRLTDVLLFEIGKFTNPGGGGMGRRLSALKTFYIYKSGRIACKTLRYDLYGKEIRTGKTRCLQISKEKIADLIATAENPDFLDAQSSYRFFRGGVDYGNSFSIAYFGKNAQKKITLTSPRLTKNDLPLPESLTVILKKLAEIDEDMEVKYELAQ
jgi:hypothetical protein